MNGLERSEPLPVRKPAVAINSCYAFYLAWCVRLEIPAGSVETWRAGNNWGPMGHPCPCGSACQHSGAQLQMQFIEVTA